VVCIHGGGFRAGTREKAIHYALTAQQGYNRRYGQLRLAPASQFPAAVHDCKAALLVCARTSKYHVDVPHCRDRRLSRRTSCAVSR
jgi:acetyl esterase/lipase